MYFLNNKKREQLILFSNVIEGLNEKYLDFKEKMECYDSEIFVILPMIIILKKIVNEDKGITDFYLPEILDPENDLYKSFNTLK